MELNQNFSQNNFNKQQKNVEKIKQTEMDMDVEHYSTDDLLYILNLVEESNAFQIKDKANFFIAKYAVEGNKPLQTFFEQVRDKLLESLDGDLHPAVDFIKEEKKELLESMWAGNNILHGKNVDGVDDNDTLYFNDSNHFAIRSRNAKPADRGPPIIMKRIISVNSQYRPTILPYSNVDTEPAFNTNFTFNLANPINNAIAFRLYSYQIPTTWYVFSTRIGNTFFQYNGEIITIPDGNYTLTQLINKINALAQLHPATADLIVTTPDPITGRISFQNNNLYAQSVAVIFYVQKNIANVYSCGEVFASKFQTVGINQTLGWMLGFRITPDAVTGDVYAIIPRNAALVADVPPDVYGPKYFVLNVDDFTNQGLTGGLMNITNTKTKVSLSVTDYYKTIRASCLLREGNLTNAQKISLNNVIEENTPINTNGFVNKMPGPNSGGAFAYVPLINIPALRTQQLPVTAYGADVAIFERKYFKPTKLERMHVGLIDDKGNLVNLYDNEWTFSLIVDEML